MSDIAKRHSDAVAIWQSAVQAVKPLELIRAALANPNLPIKSKLKDAQNILVVGAGKAGAAMACALEAELGDHLDRIHGLVNVPELPADATNDELTPKKITLHQARPLGVNQPTKEGVDGAERILQMVSEAGENDVGLCLLSGGGSALLPAPVDGVTLEDKQEVTKMLHACGATINEMNTVRKHLSKVKGGRLAEMFTGRALISLIISDVIGDPLDVIASGPTSPDPTTFAEALAVLKKYELTANVPKSVVMHLEKGKKGDVEETPKRLSSKIANHIIGNNAAALAIAQRKAEELGYNVLNLGSYIEGETKEVAVAMAGVVRSIRHDGVPASPPVCLLSGGETTVSLAKDHGLGGRNQEFVLALANKLGQDELNNVFVLSGGTDGEDGPTDAAGAFADETTLVKAEELGLDAGDFLRRNDAYHFFEQTGGLLKTGLTQTNVMDVRVILVE